MIRLIVLQLADDTTDERCGRCEHVSYARSVWIVDGGAHQAYECRLTGEALQPSREPLRTDDCRSAELRPETVEALLYARKCLSALAHANDRAAAAHAALADFERLFGGET